MFVAFGKVFLKERINVLRHYRVGAVAAVASWGRVSLEVNLESHLVRFVAPSQQLLNLHKKESGTFAALILLLLFQKW